ncbi:hypothetical protein N8390_10605 [Amylibacter sp.]|nr:hypothetical protein [Amylibacter sp.]
MSASTDPNCGKAPLPGMQKFGDYLYTYKINRLTGSFSRYGRCNCGDVFGKKCCFSDKSHSADATYYESILNKKLESGTRLIIVKIPRVLLVHN